MGEKLYLDFNSAMNNVKLDCSTDHLNLKCVLLLLVFVCCVLFIHETPSLCEKFCWNIFLQRILSLSYPQENG